jgi:transcriptional regulator with GAF, ATPase, and Fis domain
MNDSGRINSYLTELKWKLSKIAGIWSTDDYKNFIRFYSSIIPNIMGVERCTVFVLELKSDKICSVYGTGLDQKLVPPMDGSIVGDVIKSGQRKMINDLQNHAGYHSHIEQLTGFTGYNMLCVPIRSLSGNDVSGAVQLINKLHSEQFTEEDFARLEEIAYYLSFSIESIVLINEISRIAESMGKEVGNLQQETIHGVKIIAESPAMREVLDMVRMVSKSPVNVLIQGENGTGKELIARMIHHYGDRKDSLFLPVNCATMPESLAESQFFGHDKGAFTGADSSRSGLFEEASGGTLFLDEIGEMPLLIQPKVLRAIQEGEGQRLGSNHLRQYNLRLISATNRNLADEVKKGSFREDLFYRLFSVEIYIPPLRDRKDDILPLSLSFLRSTNERFGKNVVGFSPEVLSVFENYWWPGNVRQLQKEIERLVALTENGELIRPVQLSGDLYSLYTKLTKPLNLASEGDLALADQVKRLEIILINKAMRRCELNKTKASKLLKISRQGLDKKIKRYNLQF